MLRRVAGSLAIFAAAAASPAFAQAVGGRGFGDGYEWHSLEAGLARAEEANQPAMIVFHKSWCGACKRFGPVFAKSDEIKERASDFVLINVHDDEELDDAKYKPDGGYIPRILFTDPSGHVLDDVSNKNGNPSYKHFYSSGKEVAASMDRVRARFSAQDEL